MPNESIITPTYKIEILEAVKRETKIDVWLTHPNRCISDAMDITSDFYVDLYKNNVLKDEIKGIIDPLQVNSETNDVKLWTFIVTEPGIYHIKISYYVCYNKGVWPVNWSEKEFLTDKSIKFTIRSKWLEPFLNIMMMPQ